MLLARSEIRRARLRFGLLAGAVGLLIFLVFFQQTLLSSLLNSFTGALRNQSATVLVYSAEARRSLEGSVVSQEVIDQVAKVDGVAQAGPLGEATLTFVANGQQVDVAVLGAEPGQPGQPTRLVEGRLPTSAGEGVASSEDKNKGFAIGDRVTTAAGNSPVTIVGLTKQSQFSVQPTLYVTFDTYTALRKASNPDATSVPASAVAVIPNAGVSPQAVADAINAAVPGVEALTRSQAVTSAPGVSSVQSSFAIVLALAVAVVALVTGFFFLILTVQKSASLTLLHAVGAPAGYLIRNLLQQVTLVLGVALMIAIGLLLAATAGSGSGLALTVEPAAFGHQHGDHRDPVAGGGGLLGVASPAHRPGRGGIPSGTGGSRVKIALRELRRRPGRFLPAAIALVLLTLLLLVLGGLLDGLYNGSTGALRVQPGDLLTYSADAKLSLVRSRVDAATVAQVQQVPGVEQVGGIGVALLGAEVPGEKDEASVALFGYEQAPRGVPSPSQHTGDVYADRSLQAHGVKLGQTLLLGPHKYAVVVVGWVTDTNFLLQGGLWGNIDTWRQAVASARPDAVLAPGTYQALTVTTSPGTDPVKVAADIDAATGGATHTVTRSFAVDSLPGLRQQRSTFNAIIYTTFLVAALVVALFFALLTLERVGMYAVFKAMGASSRQIFTQVATQAVVIALLSFVIGALLALGASFGIPPEVPLQLTTGRAAEVLVGLIVMSAAGSALSLRRVVRVDPASAIG